MEPESQPSTRNIAKKHFLEDQKYIKTGRKREGFPRSNEETVPDQIQRGSFLSSVSDSSEAFTHTQQRLEDACLVVKVSSSTAPLCTVVGAERARAV